METPKTVYTSSSHARLVLIGSSIFFFSSIFLAFIPLKAEGIDKVEGYNSISTEGSMASRFLFETGDWRAFYKEEYKSKGMEDEEKEQKRSFGVENSFFALGEVSSGGMLREIGSSNAYTPGSSVFSDGLLNLNIDPRSYGTMGCDVLLLPETAVFPSAHVVFLHSPEKYLQGGVYLAGEMVSEVPGVFLGVTLIGIQTHLLGEGKSKDDWWYEDLMPPLIERDFLHLGGRLRWELDGSNGFSFMNTFSLTPLSPPASYTSLHGEMKLRPYKGSSFEIHGNCQLWDKNYISTRGDRAKWSFNGGVSLEAAFLPRLGLEASYQYSRGFNGSLWGAWVPLEEKIGAGCFFGFSIIDVSGKWNREVDIEENGTYTLENEVSFAVSLNIMGLKVEPSALYTWEKEDFTRSVYKLQVRGDSPLIYGKGSLSLVMDEEVLLEGRTSWELSLDPVTVKASIFTLEGFSLSGGEDAMDGSETEVEEPGFFEYIGIQFTGIISYSNK